MSMNVLANPKSFPFAAALHSASLDGVGSYTIQTQFPGRGIIHINCASRKSCGSCSAFSSKQKTVYSHLQNTVYSILQSTGYSHLQNTEYNRLRKMGTTVYKTLGTAVYKVNNNYESFTCCWDALSSPNASNSLCNVATSLERCGTEACRITRTMAIKIYEYGTSINN